jgi:Co/Zn/Cd efflux system component
MGALASVLTIWVITGVLVYMAVMRIVENKYEIDAVYMLITAGLGVLVNIVCVCARHIRTRICSMALVLHFCGGGHLHSHGGMSHGHSHVRTRFVSS